MIVRSGNGYKVKSEGGKNLSKPGLSKEQAERRLRQVEFFKAHRPRRKAARGEST